MVSQDITLDIPTSLGLLLEQAVSFCENFNNLRTVYYEYEELARKKSRLSFRIKSEKLSKKEKQEKIAVTEATLKILLETRQEVINHQFRLLLHKDLNYQQAFICYKKKIFDFSDTSSETGVDDQAQFDGFIAFAFVAYQNMSTQKDKIIILKKRRLSKIKKLAANLQVELNSVLLFDDVNEQTDIYETLNRIINIENAPKILPKRRHTKVARELAIKDLAFNVYGEHFNRLAKHKARSFYGEEPKQKLTLNTSFVDVIAHVICIIDSEISERRVASVITKIKSEIQIKHPSLFESS